MISRKKLKIEQAERIVQSLNHKKLLSSNLNPKKIKKRKKIMLEESLHLNYKTKNGNLKKLHWIITKTKNIQKKSFILPTPKETYNCSKTKSNNSENDETVNYADIFFSVYKNLQQEEIINNSNSNSNTKEQESVSKPSKDHTKSKNRRDNFNLISKNISEKNNLVKIKESRSFQEEPCIVINSHLIEKLRKSSSL